MYTNDIQVDKAKERVLADLVRSSSVEEIKIKLDVAGKIRLTSSDLLWMACEVIYANAVWSKNNPYYRDEDCSDVMSFSVFYEFAGSDMCLKAVKTAEFISYCQRQVKYIPFSSSDKFGRNAYLFMWSLLMTSGMNAHFASEGKEKS